MHLRPYEPSDKMYIGALLHMRKMDVEESLQSLPETGYIVFQDNFPVAAGFLRRVEGGFGQVDSYITDPSVPGKQRDQALDLITDALIKRAKELELRGIVAFSVDQNTISRSLRHGFAALGHVVITKELK